MTFLGYELPEGVDTKQIPMAEKHKARISHAAKLPGRWEPLVTRSLQTALFYPRHGFFHVETPAGRAHEDSYGWFPMFVNFDAAERWDRAHGGT